MNFRKIVAHLAYSPAMIWHLAAYDAKIKQDKTNNLKIILFTIFNLIIIAVAVSVNNNHHLSLATPGINTKPINTSLSDRPLINTESKISNFNQNSFFGDINHDSQLVQIYNHFKINNSSAKNMHLVQSPIGFANCTEINRSPINAINKVDINPDLAVYTHNCQKQYYGIAISGRSDNDFITLNNGNLLLKDVDIKTTQALAFQINVINSTTNTQSPLKIDPGQSLKYTATATNMSSKLFSGVVKINLSDITEYARILNNSLSSNQAIYWQINQLQPGQSTSYDIYAKADHHFSNQPLNLNSPNSHDCQLSLSLGDATANTLANCNLVKQAELATHRVFPPSRHDHKILISVLLFLLIVIVLKILHIARINFISKEIRIIRHKINQGII